MKTGNPLSKIADRDSESIGADIVSFQRLSFFEKIGIVSSLIMAAGVLIVSGFSFIIDFGKLNMVNILIDLILIIGSLTSLYFMFGIYRRKVIIETLIDTAFQEGVYNRLKPLIENIANSRIDADIILDRMSNMDIKIENILKGNILKRDESEVKYVEKYIETEMHRPVMIGTPLGFIIKSIFMIIITMAIFMFLVNFNLGRLTPFVTLSIFILWWVFITNEYSLWKNTSAWLIVFFPIAIVPVSVMILGNLVNYNILMAVLYASISIYTFVYYLWTIYTTTGAIPFVKRRMDDVTNGEEKFFLSQQKGMLRDMWTGIKKRD